MPLLQDKIVLVTGATSGIGEVTARELAKQGAHVVLLARDAAKADITRRTIKAAAGHDKVDVLLADMSVPQQVRAAAAEFHERYPRLDVLVNNAGMMSGEPRQLTANAQEVTFATNHLGPFLLTSLLFDKLRQSPAARIVNVASKAYFVARPDFDDLNAAHDYGPLRSYANSKLFNIMFTQELARRLRAQGISNVTTNTLHPGAVASAFGDSSSGIFSQVLRLSKPFMISSEKGAETSIYLASSPEVNRISGGFFDKKKAAPVKHSFNTPENARRLWEISEELTGTTFLS